MVSETFPFFPSSLFARLTYLQDMTTYHQSTASLNDLDLDDLLDELDVEPTPTDKTYVPDMGFR